MIRLGSQQLLTSNDRTYEVVGERGLTPWMVDFEIKPEALASCSEGLRLVKAAKPELCPAQSAHGRYVEVEAESCIGTFPLGVS